MEDLTITWHLPLEERSILTKSYLDIMQENFLIPEYIIDGRENLSHFWRKEMWPPPSPDFNPIDFEMWSILEAKAYNVSHSFIPILKAKLEAVWADIPAEDVRASSA